MMQQSFFFSAIRCLQWVLVAFIFIGQLAGCAWQTASRVKPDDYKTKGVRYWLASPYLLVKERVVLNEEHTLFVQTKDGLQQVSACRLPETCLEDKLSREMAQSGKGTGDGKVTGQEIPNPPGSSNGGNNTPPATSAPPASGPPDSEPTPSGSLSIAWLPDYCEQYAYSSRAFLAKSNVTVSLADGWKLEKITADTDSTALASSIIDLLKTKITVSGAALTGSDEVEDEEAQAGELKTWARVKTTYLSPGIYRIFGRKNCSERAEFSLDSFKIVESTHWQVEK